MTTFHPADPDGDFSDVRTVILSIRSGAERVNDKQTVLNNIQAEMEEINEMLSSIKDTTGTLEYLRQSALLSEQACDDIYQNTILPAVNRIYEKQKVLLQTCEAVTQRRTKKNTH